jgi:hypothetical protein
MIDDGTFEGEICDLVDSQGYKLVVVFYLLPGTLYAAIKEYASLMLKMAIRGDG